MVFLRQESKNKNYAQWSLNPGVCSQEQSQAESSWWVRVLVWKVGTSKQGLMYQTLDPERGKKEFPSWRACLQCDAVLVLNPRAVWSHSVLSHVCFSFKGIELDYLLLSGVINFMSFIDSWEIFWNIVISVQARNILMTVFAMFLITLSVSIVS